MRYFKQYDNGLKLAVKTLSGIKSVTMGIFVGAGSADENNNNNGISHYIEHMLFKGTKKRSAFDIADSIDSIGAQINAFTTKEMTCYYTKSITEHAEKTFEILSDIFFNSTFDQKESEKEKKVIFEEIAMVEDRPDDICVDSLATAFFGNNFLGKTILGTKETVGALSNEDVKEYMQKYYIPSNTVISVAGSLKPADAEKLAEKYFASVFNGGKGEIVREKPRKVKPRQIDRFKDAEQVHLCFGFPSPKFNSKISNEIAVINTILGGGMSSRLFQKIREEKGLAYQVYSYPSAYRKSGIYTIYAAVNPSMVKQSAELILEEIKNIREKGITKQEFERGKEQIKSALIFGQESSSSIMNAYGRYMVITGKMLNLENKIKRINNLTMEDIEVALKNLFEFDKLCASYVGREDSRVDLLSLNK